MKNDKERWRGVTALERQRYISQELLIPHPTFLNALIEIERIANRCRNEDRGLAVFVSGSSGSGKTFLTKELKRRHAEDHEDIVSRVPLVAFKPPFSITQRAFSSALLKSLYDPNHNSGSADEMFGRAIYIMRQVGTWIICIDDIQDIPERRRTGGIMQIGNWIRDLIDVSKCVVVLLGTPAGKPVIENNSQLRRRTCKRVQISSFSIGTRDEHSRFRRFLLELDKRLPLAELCDLSEIELSRMLYWASYGVMDYIVQLVTEAIPFAVTAGREKLSIDDFQAAFRKVFQDAAVGTDPFSADQRVLDKEGEPFHDWFDTSNPRI